MKNLKIETRQSKAGNDYQFIYGESTYYLSALKKARTKDQTELLGIPAESLDFTKHLLYNRILKGFVCKTDSWNVVKDALETMSLPDDWKDQVKKILPKAVIFNNKPAKSKVKPTKQDNSVIETLVSKLEKYPRWDEVPKESISKINTVCESEGVKIAQIRKAFESTREPVTGVNDLEL